MAPRGCLVKVNPSGETNEPEPPLLKRTEPNRTASSHCWLGSKPYLAWTFSLGKALKSHMPSSAQAGTTALRLAREYAQMFHYTPSPAKLRRERLESSRFWRITIGFDSRFSTERAGNT